MAGRLRCQLTMKSALCTGLFIIILTTTAGTRNVGEEKRKLISLCNSSNIIYEDYAYLGLLDIPADILNNAKVLFLEYNNISILSDQFWNNECAELHNYSTLCCRLPELMILDLSYNKIQTITPHFFYCLEQLTNIYLTNNKLKAIDSIFTNNNLLRLISFVSNEIEFFHPETFQNLTNLKKLYIGNNLICDIHQDAFRGLYNLETLDIHRNLITEFDVEIFRHLGNLKYLYINQNSFTYFPEGIFHYLENLEQLNASCNRIAHLSSTCFFSAKNLLFLDLSYNVIEAIDRFTFQELERMHQVILRFNRLKSVYLSRISISLTPINDTKVIDLNTEICTGTNENVPCFVSSRDLDTENTRIFHYMDFSFNNISEIIFSKNYAAHTLEVMRLTLAGNPSMLLPIPFIKQEKYIALLDLNETNLSWKNITLLNEILQLPNLKTLSISGCEACEYYMRQLIFSILNPNNRIQIECEELHTYATHPRYSESSRVFSELEVSENNTQDSLYTDFIEKINISEYSDYSNLYPCHKFEQKIFVHDPYFGAFFEIYCPSIADCSFVSLSTFPKINSDEACVLLSHNDITFLGPNVFLDFRNMQLLDLSHNRLSYLSGEIFINQFELNILKLDNNNLVHLNSSMFKNLTNLMILTLQGNRISSYDPDTLTSLQYLEFVSVDFCDLITFHDETLNNLYSLRVLIMQESCNMASQNHILNDLHFASLISLVSCKIIGFHFNSSSISSLFYSDVLHEVILEDNLLPAFTNDAFENLKVLDGIHLIRNGITNLPKNTFKELINLQQLVISENEIKYFHDDLFVNTIQLIYLNASHNQISCVSSRTFDFLTVLEILDLSYNFIVFLDWKVFSQLWSIEKLILSDNFIGSASNSDREYCCNCTRESVNVISNNCISFEAVECYKHNISSYLSKNHFTANIPNIKNLLSLVLENNHITALDGNTFEGSPLLKYINLSFNKITQIDNKTFASTPVLRILKLSFNYMSVIRNDIFKNLKNLVLLDLSSNRLELIEEGAFLSLNSLIYLDISFNRLKMFDFNALSQKSSLKVILLNDNYLLSLDITQEFPLLTKLALHNNQLKNDAVGALVFFPALQSIDISNTSVCYIEAHLLQFLHELGFLVISNECLQGVTCSHFINLQALLILDLSVEGTTNNSPDTRLSWKNITLINCWFEMPNLAYLKLTGHPICDDLQRTQIIEQLFLSEHWKTVICSTETYPDFIVTQNGLGTMSFPSSIWYNVDRIAL